MKGNKTVAVVCEYNPFHNGHKYHIDSIRENGADCIIGIMSGNFTQRGDAAIISKYERAKAAVLCGIDLAVELPFPFCCSYADAFAGAGVYIASRLLADELSFGSECGNIEKLSKIANISASSEFSERFSALDNRSRSTSYYALLEEYSGEKLLPNDILAIHYIRAIKELSASLIPSTVKREGTGYNAGSIVRDALPSATAVRRMLFEGECIRDYLPKGSYDVLTQNIGKYSDLTRLERVVLAHFRLTEPSKHSKIADMPLGFAERVKYCALRASGLDEMISMLNDVSMTKARIRRLILFCLCGVQKDDLDYRKGVAYVNLLAANERGRRYLSEHRKDFCGFVVTKPADAQEKGRQFELCRASDSLYSLASERILSPADLIRQSPVML